MLKMYLFVVILLVFLIVKTQMVAIERTEHFEIHEKHSQHVHSRRRRYLTFPEGSSLQLVYDQIIGVVDFTNIHIFGITCALAWQLPHKPFFHEHHAEMHNNKISISVNESDDKIDINERPQYTGHVYHFDTFFNRSNYHAHKLDDRYYEYLKSEPKINRPPLNSKYQYDDWQKYKTNKKQWNYSHDVYPALRMRRNIASDTEKLNTSSIHAEVKQLLQHHRETRFSLYKSIEKYLNAKGENGVQCIQLAICETMQMNHKVEINEPDSFVKELLRVIFSLPSPKLHSKAGIPSNKYDQVLNEIDYHNIDCHNKYPECSNSIWSKSFTF